MEPAKLSPMNTLDSSQRRALRAKAHHLHPVVLVGQHGLTPAVLHEIDLALLAHELIKVRVFDDQRHKRDQLLATICTALDCAPVQHLGKVLVIWRANPALAEAAAPPPRRPEKATSKPHVVKRHGPRPALDPVRERRRGTSASTTGGGIVRRGPDRGKPASAAAGPIAPQRERRRSTSSSGARDADEGTRNRPARPWTAAKPSAYAATRPPRDEATRAKAASNRRPADESGASPPRDRHAGKPPRPMTVGGPRGYGDKTKARGHGDSMKSGVRGHGDKTKARGYVDSAKTGVRAFGDKTRRYGDMKKTGARGYGDKTRSSGDTTKAGARSYGDKAKRGVPAGKSSSASTRKSPVGRRPPRDPLSSAPVPSRRRRKG